MRYTIRYKITVLKVCAVFMLIFTVLYSCAQKQYAVVSSCAFSKQIFPGTIPIGLRGKPLIHHSNISEFIYIETKDKAIPEWDSAWKNGNLYLVNTVAVKNDSVQLGTDAATQKTVSVVAKNGDHLWKLELTPQTSSDNADSTNTADNNQILLVGKFNRKRVSLTVNAETILMPERRE